MPALDFARDELDIIAPASDLLDTRAYDRLMQQTKSGSYLGVVFGRRSALPSPGLPRKQRRLADLGARGRLSRCLADT